MSSAQQVEPDILAAYNAWWGKITRQGDPIRRPNLSLEAFREGYLAATPQTVTPSRAHPHAEGE